MYSGHQAFFNAKGIMDYLCQRGQTVGGAGSIGYNSHIRSINFLIDTHDKGGGILILGRSRDHNLLGAALEMSRCLFCGGEYTGGFYNVFRTAFAPRNLLGIHAAINCYFPSVYNQLTVLCLYFAAEMAMDAVILGHIDHVVQIHKRVIDADDLILFRLGHRCAEYQTTDASKPIDANFHCHVIKHSYPQFHCL